MGPKPAPCQLPKGQSQGHGLCNLGTQMRWNIP